LFRANKADEYLSQFSELNAKKAEELRKKLEALKISRLKEEFIVKILDTLPASVDEMKVLLQGYVVSINQEDMKKVTDPFFTTRTTRHVGLGLPLFAAAAERCNGDFKVEKAPGQGLRVKASFQYGHIDRAPLGDIASTITTLIMGNSGIDFVYTHIVDGREFSLDTREIKAEMADLALTDPMVIHQLTKTIRNSLRRLDSDDGEEESKEAKNGKADN